ncbi:MAG: quinol dehydrogenase ferredoxin subunit NapH [Gammaproteobacteria bacterium]|nr:quinol dehydrogenase ferredoxin subunit NapH [Gammaproteobacteria bacterium]
MAIRPRPGKEAVEAKGWLRANKWLILRRLSQFGILGLFLLGPLAGVWIVKGNLAYSYTLDFLPLSDPHILLQSVLAGVEPHKDAIIGVVIVTVFYMLIGGRVFCSWVCPVNLVTDLACCTRRMLGIRTSTQLSRNARYWLLGVTLLLPLVTGTIVWEMFNPVSMAFRGLLFGLGLAWVILLGIFLFDIFVSKEGWCGRLCPVGAFYSLLGRKSLVRVVATDRDKCDDCMDCFEVCPEEQVIRPALKGADKGLSPVILSSQCTNCGRCIDVCAEDVFHFGLRSHKQSDKGVEAVKTGAEKLDDAA